MGELIGFQIMYLLLNLKSLLLQEYYLTTILAFKVIFWINIQVSVEHSTVLAFGDYVENKGNLWNMDKYPVS